MRFRSTEAIVSPDRSLPGDELVRSSATAQLKDHPQGCVERWQWVHATATVGSAAKSKALIVDFDSTGKVCDHAYSVQ